MCVYVYICGACLEHYVTSGREMDGCSFLDGSRCTCLPYPRGYMAGGLEASDARSRISWKGPGWEKLRKVSSRIEKGKG